MKMKMMRSKYDMLLNLVLDKVRNYLFKDISDTLLPIGMCNEMPSAQDIEFVSFITTVHLLHINKVDMNTDFPDIAELKPDILKILSELDDLKESMYNFKREHMEVNKQDDDGDEGLKRMYEAMKAYNFKSKFES